VRDLGPRVRPADEWIVRGRTALVPQAQNRADVVAQALRTDPDAVVVARVQPIALADSDVQRPVRPNRSPPPNALLAISQPDRFPIARLRFRLGLTVLTMHELPHAKSPTRLRNT
jgi:hypothetical protein